MKDDPCYLSMVITKNGKSSMKSVRCSHPINAMWHMRQLLDSGFRIVFHALADNKLASERLLAHKVGRQNI